MVCGVLVVVLIDFALSLTDAPSALSWAVVGVLIIAGVASQRSRHWSSFGQGVAIAAPIALAALPIFLLLGLIVWGL